MCIQGYEADEDGDVFKRKAVTANTVQVDVTNVTSALEDAACDANDERVDKTVDKDTNEKVCRIIIKNLKVYLHYLPSLTLNI